MKIVCSLAMSINGFVARPNGEEDFLSAANWDDFLNFSKKLDNFIVGRKSYEVIKASFGGRGFSDSEAKYKCIVSQDNDFVPPKDFILCRTPQEAVTFLADKVEIGLLIGGSGLNTSFAKVGLIDEFWLTVDPYIICDGYNLFNKENLDIKTEFIETEMFTGGRLRVKYKVLK